MQYLKTNYKIKLPKKIENEINLLKQNADNESIKLTEENQTEFKNIRNQKLGGNYIRSRVKW